MNGRQIAWAEKWEAQIKEIKEDLENIEDLKYEVKEKGSNIAVKNLLILQIIEIKE